MGVRAETLGGFRVTVAGNVLPEDAWGRRKARQLFKCLLSRPCRRVAKNLLVEWLWPDSDPWAAAGTLRETGLDADSHLIMVEGSVGSR